MKGKRDGRTGTSWFYNLNTNCLENNSNNYNMTNKIFCLNILVKYSCISVCGPNELGIPLLPYLSILERNQPIRLTCIGSNNTQ